MSRLTFISLFCVVILALVSLVYWQGSQQDEQLADQAKSSNESDFFIINAQTTQFNESGKVDHHLEAKEVKHFPVGNYTLAEQPNITLFSDNGTPWNIRSQQGRLNDSNNQVNFWQSVRLQRETPNNPLKLKTEKLTLLIDKDLAYTDQQVDITDNATHINAIGMNADLAQSRVKFLSNVQMTHDPAKTP